MKTLTKELKKMKTLTKEQATNRRVLTELEQLELDEYILDLKEDLDLWEKDYYRDNTIIKDSIKITKRRIQATNRRVLTELELS